MPGPITHRIVKQLVELGAVRGVRVTGQAGGWSVLVRFGRVERILATQRSGHVRVFRNFKTLVRYLSGLGLSCFDVDASNFETGPITRPARPDRKAALKRVHAAAEHDAWFRAQVQEGLMDLEEGRVVTEEAHTKAWALRRAALARQIRDTSR
jgi:hypothetical protein